MTNQEIKSLTNEQLVRAFQETTNNQIFGEIYSRHYDSIFYTCLGYTKNRDVAYDLVQDISLRILHKLSSLEHPHLLGHWIGRISTNHCIDYCKKQNRIRTSDITGQLEMIEETNDIQVLLEKERLLNDMEQLMKELGEETSTILRLKYLEGYSIKDLQNKYKLKSSAIKMRLQRGRNRIYCLYLAQHQFAEN